MDYYVIYDCKENKYYSFFTRTGNDIIGVVNEIAVKNKTPLNDMRMYRFKTKKDWDKFINENISKFIS